MAWLKKPPAKIEVSGMISQPEWVDTGTGLCRFGVCAKDGYKSKNGEWVDKDTWFNVSCWGDFGKRVMEKLNKGDLVEVCGSPETRSWTDRETGLEKSGFQITVGAPWAYINVWRKKDTSPRSFSPPPQAPEPDDQDDGLPF